jgi:hypothetical protein
MRSATVTLYCDYCDWPLWGPAGNLAEDAVPLSDGLKLRIKAWFNSYWLQREDWPLWEPPPGLTDDEEEQLWVEEGEAIRAAIEQELGYPVTFET